MGGLAAAVDLARRGCDTTVIEKAAEPGGKMREVLVGASAIDAGPTVFTMRWVFEELFSACGRELNNQLDLVPAQCLARHAWRAGGRLDLFADVDRSAEAIAQFAGSAEAAGYRDFCKRSAAIFSTLRDSFIASQRPSPLTLTRRVGLQHIDRLWRTVPYRSLWSALSDHFRDPRLRQLFGRYATYTGCSPLAAPATLMLIAHVEQDGVWLVRGGMRRIADALQSLAELQGARFRFGMQVSEIVATDRVSAVLLENGERIEADAVVFNGDVSALAQGMLGNGVSTAAKGTEPSARSLSAITWCLKARTHGFPLEHHNVFFAEDYPSEFAAIFGRRTITASPTVYLCAQDRGAAASTVSDGAAERMLLLVNAPADGDLGGINDRQLYEVETSVFALLAQCGLQIDRTAAVHVVTRPQDFAGLFPGSGGALYGRAGHGALGSFSRSGAASRIKGLYLAGGSVHPGPGIPMATMSGRLAAARLLEDMGGP